eukprot:gene33953-36762_t
MHDMRERVGWDLTRCRLLVEHLCDAGALRPLHASAAGRREAPLLLQFGPRCHPPRDAPPTANARRRARSRLAVRDPLTRSSGCAASAPVAAAATALLLAQAATAAANARVALSAPQRRWEVVRTPHRPEHVLAPPAPSHRLLASAANERATERALRAAARAACAAAAPSSAPVFLDVGAHEGRRHNPDPQPACAAPLAVAAVMTPLQLDQGGSLDVPAAACTATMQGTRRGVRDNNALCYARRSRVGSVRIDDVAAGPVQVLKIDAEGAEIGVLRSARRLLATRGGVRHLIVELAPTQWAFKYNTTFAEGWGTVLGAIRAQRYTC